MPSLAPARKMYSSGLSSTWERNEWAECATGTYSSFGGARSLGALGTIRHLDHSTLPRPLLLRWDQGWEHSPQANVWGHLLLTQGQPKGLRVLWTSKGQVTPPRHPRLRLVHPAPRLTRALLRQDPTTYLSKSEVTRLAGRGVAPGHGTQTANLPRGVRFPNDSL